MFRRIIIEDWTVIFTIAAFITALSVYVTVFYRTIRMRPAKSEQLAHLPFEDETATTPSHHE